MNEFATPCKVELITSLLSTSNTAASSELCSLPAVSPPRSPQPSFPLTEGEGLFFCFLSLKQHRGQNTNLWGIVSFTNRNCLQNLSAHTLSLQPQRIQQQLILLSLHLLLLKLEDPKVTPVSQLLFSCQERKEPEKKLLLFEGSFFFFF